MLTLVDSLCYSHPYPPFPLRGGVRGTERDEHRQQERDGKGMVGPSFSCLHSLLTSFCSSYRAEPGGRRPLREGNGRREPSVVRDRLHDRSVPWTKWADPIHISERKEEPVRWDDWHECGSGERQRSGYMVLLFSDHYVVNNRFFVHYI